MQDDGDESRTTRDEDESHGHVVVPWTRLSEQALLGVITEFVTREGTEYGAHEVPLARKIEQVRYQLERGEVILVFDARSESVNLCVAEKRKR